MTVDQCFSSFLYHSRQGKSPGQMSQPASIWWRMAMRVAGGQYLIHLQSLCNTPSWGCPPARKLWNLYNRCDWFNQRWEGNSIPFISIDYFILLDIINALYLTYNLNTHSSPISLSGTDSNLASKRTKKSYMQGMNTFVLQGVFSFFSFSFLFLW